jgi:beta-N-acetylhexosaminidase
LVEKVIGAGKPVVTVALRTPHDLALYPASQTHICTYGSHWPSMKALASAVYGEAPLTGRLPAAIPGLYPRGHGIQT